MQTALASQRSLKWPRKLPLIQFAYMQAVTTAQRGFDRASQKKHATETQVDELRSQRDSQMQGEESSIEDLEVQIAEATHTISTLNHQVRP
jgi:hypothetical protein